MWQLLFPLTLSWLILTGALLPAASAAETPARPNIVLFLTDDQRDDTLGCYGHPIVKTPNIDRLAADGVRFDNMFVTTSICAASRASIFTGLTERTHGYTFGKKPVDRSHIQTSYPAILKRSGYHTGFVGKFGVAVAEKQRSVPEMFDYFQNLSRNPYFKKQDDGSQRHLTEICGDHAVKFLQDIPEGRPFCLSISFNAAHAEDGDKRPGIGHFPWPKAVDGMYEDVTVPQPRLGDPKYFETLPPFLQKSMNRARYFWRWDTPQKYQTNMRAYFRMLSGIDHVVGRVLGELKQRGLDQNTVVIYSADNGYYMGDRGFAGKWSHFEQSLRVPLIIRDPREAAKNRGRVQPAMALNIDLAPTFLELADLDVPASYQGTSLLPLLQATTPPQWRRDFYCEHLMARNDIPQWRGVRAERFVYARYFTQNPVYEFLHDLETDPDQLQNLASRPEHKEILAKMRARCEQFEKTYPARETPDP